MIVSGRNWEGKAVVQYRAWTVLLLQEKERDWILKIADELLSAKELRRILVRYLIAEELLAYELIGIRFPRRSKGKKSDALLSVLA